MAFVLLPGSWLSRVSQGTFTRMQVTTAVLKVQQKQEMAASKGSPEVRQAAQAPRCSRQSSVTAVYNCCRPARPPHEKVA